MLYRMRLRVLRGLSRRLGKDWFIDSPDRIFLEDRLFGIFRMEGLRILSIGCHPTSLIYRYLLPANRYHTLDIDPDNARFGARNHTVGDCRELAVLLPGRGFDLVLFNGIIGYGINEEKTFQDFLRAAHRILGENGWLIIGYNDIPSRNPELMKTIDVSLFTREDFLGSIPSRLVLPTHNRHTFEFYRRAPAP
jgi:hypothetical protein